MTRSSLAPQSAAALLALAAVSVPLAGAAAQGIVPEGRGHVIDTSIPCNGTATVLVSYRPPHRRRVAPRMRVRYFLYSSGRRFGSGYFQSGDYRTNDWTSVGYRRHAVPSGPNCRLVARFVRAHFVRRDDANCLVGYRRWGYLGSRPRPGRPPLSRMVAMRVCVRFFGTQPRNFRPPYVGDRPRQWRPRSPFQWQRRRNRRQRRFQQ